MPTTSPHAKAGGAGDDTQPLHQSFEKTPAFAQAVCEPWFPPHLPLPKQGEENNKVESDYNDIPAPNLNFNRVHCAKIC